MTGNKGRLLMITARRGEVAKGERVPFHSFRWKGFRLGLRLVEIPSTNRMNAAKSTNQLLNR